MARMAARSTCLSFQFQTALGLLAATGLGDHLMLGQCLQQEESSL